MIPFEALYSSLIVNELISHHQKDSLNQRLLHMILHHLFVASSWRCSISRLICMYKYHIQNFVDVLFGGAEH